MEPQVELSPPSSLTGMEKNDRKSFPLVTNRDGSGGGTASFSIHAEDSGPPLGRHDSKESMASSPTGVLAYASNQVVASLFSDGSPEQKLSSVGLCCNMLLSIIGTTVLGITAQMKRGGWFFAPLMLIAGCAMVTEMTRLVSVTTDKIQSEKGITVKAYQDFAEGALGHGAKAVSAVCSTLGLLGMICNGFLLEAENLQFSLPISWWWPGDDQSKSGQNWWALILSSTTVVYAFLPAGQLLQKAAKVGPVICVLCIIFAWVGNGSAAAELKDFPDACRNTESLPYWSSSPGVGRPNFGGVMLDIAGVASYGFYCFAVVVTVPTLRDEMANPSELVKSASIAYWISTGLFITIMLLGYWGSGNLAPDNVIKQMRNDRPDGWWALNDPWETGSGAVSGQIFAWMIILNLLMTDAIYVPCTVTAFEAIAPEFFKIPIWGIALRIAICTFRFLVAVLVDSFVALTSLTSALFCVVVNILMPILAFYKQAPQRPSTLLKAVHGFIFVFGCIVMVMGTYGAIESIVNQASQGADAGTSFREGISEECKIAFASAGGKLTPSTPPANLSIDVSV